MVTCYKCGHTLEETEATRIPVKWVGISTPPDRYFCQDCIPDYMQVTLLAMGYAWEARVYQTEVVGIVIDGKFISIPSYKGKGLEQ